MAERSRPSGLTCSGGVEDGALRRPTRVVWKAAIEARRLRVLDVECDDMSVTIRFRSAFDGTIERNRVGPGHSLRASQGDIHARLPTADRRNGMPMGPPSHIPAEIRMEGRASTDITNPLVPDCRVHGATRPSLIPRTVGREHLNADGLPW